MVCLWAAQSCGIAHFFLDSTVAISASVTDYLNNLTMGCQFGRTKARLVKIYRATTFGLKLK